MVPMRVLLISHQLDYSGAPLALLELARVLQGLGHDVHLAALGPGPLGNEFLTHGVRPYQPRSPAFDLYIANTVVSVPAALALAPSADSVLAWIHETGFFFRILRASPRDYSLDRVRFAAFPARFQLDEFAQWMPAAVRMQLRNCIRMPTSDPYATAADHYVCSGRWEARKNQAGCWNWRGRWRPSPGSGSSAPIRPRALNRPSTGSWAPSLPVSRSD